MSFQRFSSVRAVPRLGPGLSMSLFLSLFPGLSMTACNSDPYTTSLSAGTGTGTGSGSCTPGSSPVSRAFGSYLENPGEVTSASAETKSLIHGLKRLSGHIPRAVRRFEDQGKAQDSRELPVTIALNLNNEADLDERIAGLYQPGSPNFHQFLSPEEFRARYSPTDAQISQVQNFLRSQGLQPTSVSENRLLIQARGKVAALNSAFHTEVHDYQDSSGIVYFAPAYEFQIPSGMPIQAVHGLHDVMKLKSHAQRQSTDTAAAAGASDAAVAHRGTGPNGAYSPADIRKAYSIPTTVNGAGQKLALLELDGYRESDVTAYEKQFGLPAVPLKNVLVGGFKGSVGAGAGEVTLDIELMIAVAPGAAQILVYVGPNTDQGILATYSRIANDNLARQVSTSWGASEEGSSTSFIQSENVIFKQMAVQGQSMFAAAGDDGAYDNGSTLSVDDPASQPYVVAVGGTRLTTNTDGSYARETTWNAGGAPSSGGGGGGVSTNWTIPTYQTGVGSGQTLGSTRMRNVPDVALDSDPATGYAIYFGGAWNTYGGTSCAAPLWAAFTALVNQQREAAGLGALGFPNPTLYQIGQGSHYSAAFFDIADGSTNMHFPAVSGYDNATGWGSFNGAGLFDELIQDLSSAPVGGGSPVIRPPAGVSPPNSCRIS
ncbi:MAG: S53 family peptidase [Methylotenera sp.]|nr:S53 family peptidase [Oligoflexia bacterium]